MFVTILNYFKCLVGTVCTKGDIFFVSAKVREKEKQINYTGMLEDTIYSEDLDRRYRAGLYINSLICSSFKTPFVSHFPNLQNVACTLPCFENTMNYFTQHA